MLSILYHIWYAMFELSGMAQRLNPALSNHRKIQMGSARVGTCNSGTRANHNFSQLFPIWGYCALGGEKFLF